MTKADLLKLLAEEYKKTVRLPDDISLKDYRDTIEREVGVRMSEKRATKILNGMQGYTSLIIVDRGKTIRVWRKKRTANEQTRHSHRATSKRVE